MRPARVLRRIHGEDVQVAVEDDSLAGGWIRLWRTSILMSRSTFTLARNEPRHEIRLLQPIRRNDLRLNTPGTQILPQHLCGRGSIARRVGRRRLDESL